MKLENPLQCFATKDTILECIPEPLEKANEGTWQMLPTTSMGRDGIDGLRAVFKHIDSNLNDESPEADYLKGKTQALSSLALPCSERRLSRESELLFRLINWLAKQLADSLDQDDTSLWVPNLHNRDRLVIHLLLRTITLLDGRKGKLLFTVSKRFLEVPPPPKWCQYHQQFLQDFFAQTQLEPITLNFELFPLCDKNTESVGYVVDPLSSSNQLRTLVLNWQYEGVLQCLAQRPRNKSFDEHCVSGMAKAFLGDFEEADKSYKQAEDSAPNNVLQARASAFRALIAVKRQGDFQYCEQIISEARSKLREDQSDEAKLERGWLFNVEALLLFRQRSFSAALDSCVAALKLISPIKSSDVLHLKINLISNLSVVYEVQGSYASAQKIWRQFQPFLSGSGRSLFGKIYFYREAGLEAKQGHIDTAYQLLLNSYNESKSAGDHFHAMLVAHDLGRTAPTPHETTQWWRLSKHHAENTGDRTFLRFICDQLASSHSEERNKRTMVDTKLGRPFHLVHLPPITPNPYIFIEREVAHP